MEIRTDWTGQQDAARFVAYEHSAYEPWEPPPDPITPEELDAAMQALIADYVDPEAVTECKGPEPLAGLRDPIAGFDEPDLIAAGIRRVVRLQQRKAALEAEEARELAGLARLSIAEAGSGADRSMVYRSLAGELALACNLSERTFQARIGDAEILVEKFPQTMTAMEAGTISTGHARVVVEGGLPIDDPVLRGRFERAVLERAGELTPGRLRKQARLAAAQIAEVGFEERHARAVEDRSVRMVELDDGMAEVIHTVPTVYAVAMLDRLTEQAKAIKAANPDEPRSLDQIRADLMTELVLTGQPTGCPDAPHTAGVGIRAEVSIVIPMLTLLGKGTEPASIAGAGPIGMAEALRLAGETDVWVRLLTDPVDEQVRAVDTYRPSRKLRRFIRGRDKRCRCPFCTRAALHGDLDHTHAWEHDGKTEDGNLALLCKRCHILKHLPGWKVRQVSPGVLEWTSPHGFVALDRPDTPIRFQ
jgi:hypothetical protein